jgi:hypothetical protein
LVAAYVVVHPAAMEMVLMLGMKEFLQALAAGLLVGALIIVGSIVCYHVWG